MFIVNFINNSNSMEVNQKCFEYPNGIAYVQGNSEKEILYGISRYAISKNDIDLLRLLLTLSIDINFKGEKGETVLMCAAQNRWCKEIIKILLDAGANVNIQDNFGRTALDFAVNAYNGNIEIIKLILDCKIDIDSQDNFQVLKRAIRKGCFEDDSRYAEIMQTVQLLIDAGININAKNIQGDTILIDAVKWSDKEIVKMLLEFQADPLIANNNGESALNAVETRSYTPGQTSDIRDMLNKHIMRNKRKRFTD